MLVEAESRLESRADLERLLAALGADHWLDRLLLDVTLTGVLSLSDRVEVVARPTDAGNAGHRAVSPRERRAGTPARQSPESRGVGL